MIVHHKGTHFAFVLPLPAFKTRPQSLPADPATEMHRFRLRAVQSGAAERGAAHFLSIYVHLSRGEAS
jgi:hypothetical protein